MELMVDLETMSLKSNALVLSIGAVKFELHNKGVEGKFEVILEVKEQEAKGRDISISTAFWWMNQNAAARSVFYDSSNRVAVPHALKQFNDFSKGCDRIWGNGANFDNVILRSLYDNFGVPYNFKFWQDMCYHTLKTLAGNPKIEIERGVEHNALADAEYQAHCAQEYYQFIERA